MILELVYDLHPPQKIYVNYTTAIIYCRQSILLAHKPFDVEKKVIYRVLRIKMVHIALYLTYAFLCNVLFLRTMQLFRAILRNILFCETVNVTFFNPFRSVA